MILVDDRFPCDANGQPAFAKNATDGVYWAMVIEKAYAKFAGTYQAMQGGTVTQGLEDLTGGIGYKFDLSKKEKEWIPPKGETPDRLYAALTTRPTRLAACLPSGRAFYCHWEPFAFGCGTSFQRGVSSRRGVCFRPAGAGGWR